MHEGLATQDAEEGVPHRFGLIDRTVQCLNVDLDLLGCYIDPATLAAEIAAVDDRNVQKGRKELPSLDSLAVLLHAPKTFPARLIHQLPEKSLVGFHEQSFGHPQVHVVPSLKGKGR